MIELIDLKGEQGDLRSWILKDIEHFYWNPSEVTKQMLLKVAKPLRNALDFASTGKLEQMEESILEVATEIEKIDDDLMKKVADRDSKKIIEQIRKLVEMKG